MQLSRNLIVMANLAAHSVHSLAASIKISNDSRSISQSVSQSVSQSLGQFIIPSCPFSGSVMSQSASGKSAQLVS